jgi:hypothetical protein
MFNFRIKMRKKGGFYTAIFPPLGAIASLEKSLLIFPGNRNNVTTYLA